MGLPTLAIHFALAFLLIPAASADRKFTINNNCNVTIWPALYGDEFASRGNKYTGVTGWEAQAHSSQSISIPEGWTGRIWGRQGCSFSSGKGTCSVGDCNGALECTTVGASVYTMLEWAISSSLGTDFYDISLIDGFNLPVEMKSNNACPSISCLTNLNAECPSALRGPTQDGMVLSCKNDQQHENFFRAGCPQTYVTLDDNSNALFSNQTCPGGLAADYTVTFCPFGTVNTTVTGPATASAQATQTNTESSLTFESPTSTFTNLQNPHTSNSSSNHLSGGAIAGIVIGSLFAVGLIAFASWFLVRRRKRSQHEFEGKNGGSREVEPFMEGLYGTPTISVGGGISTRNNGKSGETVLSPAAIVPIRREKEARTGSGPSENGSSSLGASHQLPRVLPPVDSGAPLSLGQTGSSANASRSENIDLDRIFEDRVHEDQLLAFIARRMDRNTRRDDDEGSLAPPPTYRLS